MKFIEFKQTVFSEMALVKLDQQPTHVIGYKDKIWLVGNKTPEDELKNIIDQISNDHNDNFDYEKERSWLHQDRTAFYLTKYADVFVATYKKALNGDVTLAINKGTFIDPRSSPMVKKIVQAIKPKFIIRQDEKEDKIKSKKAKGKVPHVLYHGTTSRYLREILKYGLRPGVSPSNWLMKFKDRIFLAVSKSMSQRHASNAVSTKYGKPMVIAVKVPDRSKIVADWDADSMATRGKREYDRDYAPSAPQSNRSSMQVSQDFGAFAYKGRIPSSMIQYIEVLVDKKWQKYSLEDIKKNINTISPDTIAEKQAPIIQKLVSKLKNASDRLRKDLHSLDVNDPDRFKSSIKSIIKDWKEKKDLSDEDWNEVIDVVAEKFLTYMKSVWQIKKDDEEYIKSKMGATGQKKRHLIFKDHEDVSETQGSLIGYCEK